MKNFHSALAALVAMAVAIPAGASADESWDKKSYWMGFYIGTTFTLCELLKQGQISKGDAREWLDEVYKKSEDSPEISQRTALEQALSMEQYKDCPLPR